ncbi:MAG: hypothetical protein ACRDMZ_03830 [Solirubrobacteraceae bacterium]
MKSARQGDLEVVGTYRFPYEAQLAKSAVEAFGVPGWVLDETQIRFRWYFGDALGGVKLAVRTGDAETAREILSGDHSADLAALPESHLPPALDELCPRCGAELVEVARPRGRGTLRQWLLVLVSWVFAGGPAPHYRRRARRCAACGHAER